MIKNIKRFIKSNDGLFLFLKQGLIYFRYIKSIIKRSVYDGLPIIEVGEKTAISAVGCHCFFGYYDKSPLNGDSRYALFLKVSKNSKEGDEAEVCIGDLHNENQTVIGRTHTWNWQQGAMEQWVDEKTISYNSYDDDKKDYATVRINIETGESSVTTRAAYYYNKTFTKYLSLNFYRLDQFAKGYGYSFDVDSLEPGNDGIWEVDVTRNRSNLTLSLNEVIAFETKDYIDCQHYINHVAYCPNERYIIFIHRWQVRGGEFKSRLLKYDLQEKKLFTLLDNGHVSHYCWKSESELLIYATNDKNKKGYMVVNIETGNTRLLEGLPTEDGHPTYSKDGKWVVTDTYPDNHRDQFLFLFQTEEKKLYVVDKLYSPFKYFNEHRCDLHPRWSRDNKFILVDNTAKGLRTLNIYKLKNNK